MDFPQTSGLDLIIDETRREASSNLINVTRNLLKDQQIQVDMYENLTYQAVGMFETMSNTQPLLIF